MKIKLFFKNELKQNKEGRWQVFSKEMMPCLSLRCTTVLLFFGADSKFKWLNISECIIDCFRVKAVRLVFV